MTLDDALSCGRIVKINIKDAYVVSDVADSNLDVHYGVDVSFQNTNSTAASDVGIKLTNTKREQTWFLETKEEDSGDVSMLLKWSGVVDSSDVVEIHDGLVIKPKTSLHGDEVIFAESAKIQRGRFLDNISLDDKDNVDTLTSEEAEKIVLSIQPKKFVDKRLPEEGAIGILNELTPDLVKNQDGSGVSSNAILAALVATVQNLKKLVSQLYAKRVGDYELIEENCTAVVTKIGKANIEEADVSETTVAVITED